MAEHPLFSRGSTINILIFHFTFRSWMRERSEASPESRQDGVVGGNTLLTGGSPGLSTGALRSPFPLNIFSPFAPIYKLRPGSLLLTSLL